MSDSRILLNSVVEKCCLVILAVFFFSSCLQSLGGKLVYQGTKKRASGPKCPVTGKRIQGVCNTRLSYARTKKMNIWFEFFGWCTRLCMKRMFGCSCPDCSVFGFCSSIYNFWHCHRFLIASDRRCVHHWFINTEGRVNWSVN